MSATMTLQLILINYDIKGAGSYFAEIGNWPAFMAKNGNIVHISTDFGHKKSDGNGNINLEGRKTEIVTDKKLKRTVTALSRLLTWC